MAGIAAWVNVRSITGCTGSIQLGGVTGLPGYPTVVTNTTLVAGGTGSRQSNLGTHGRIVTGTAACRVETYHCTWLGIRRLKLSLVLGIFSNLSIVTVPTRVRIFSFQRTNHTKHILVAVTGGTIRVVTDSVIHRSVDCPVDGHSGAVPGLHCAGMATVTEVAALSLQAGNSWLNGNIVMTGSTTWVQAGCVVNIPCCRHLGSMVSLRRCSTVMAIGAGITRSGKFGPKAIQAELIGPVNNTVTGIARLRVETNYTVVTGLVLGIVRRGTFGVRSQVTS